MRISLLQVASPTDENPLDRLARVGALVESAPPSDLLVLPELWLTGYYHFAQYDTDVTQRYAQLLSDGRQWASASGMYLHLGSVLEPAAKARLFNAAILLDPSGRVIHRYRKNHTMSYRSQESTRLIRGIQAEVVSTDLGRLGTAICFDLRFPSVWRRLSVHGVEIAVVPAAWPALRASAWDLLTRARAAENQCVVVACNAVGSQDGVALAGASRVIDPLGEVVAVGSETDEEIVTADIDLDSLRRLRTEFPLLTESRRW